MHNISKLLHIFMNPLLCSNNPIVIPESMPPYHNYCNLQSLSFDYLLSGNASLLGLSTNDHKIGGLKRQKYILLQFWRSEVQNQGSRSGKIFPKVLEVNLSWLLSASSNSRNSGLWLYNFNLCLFLQKAFSCLCKM